MAEVVRRYRMMRLRAGDYLCPSNDRQTLWRFHTHIDGKALGLEVDYEERTFWRAVYMPMEEAERLGFERLADSDPWGKLWREADWYLDRRQDAIAVMLKASHSDEIERA